MAERAPTTRQQAHNIREDELVTHRCDLKQCDVELTESAGYGICPLAQVCWNGILPAEPTTLSKAGVYAKDFRRLGELNPQVARCALLILNHADLMRAFIGTISKLQEARYSKLPRSRFR